MRYTIKRWGYLILLSFISLLIVIIIQPVINPIPDGIGTILGKYHQIIIILFIIMIFALIGFTFFALGGFRARDFISHTTLRYPPAYLSVFIGIALYYFILISLFRYRSDEILYSKFLHYRIELIIAICMGLLITIIISLIRGTSEKQIGKKENKELSFKHNNIEEMDDKDLIQWIKEETPIKSPDKDLFDRAQIARRITRILKESPLKTIGILGSYGSGKSSIVKMVQYYLKYPEEMSSDINHNKNQSYFDPKKIIVCKVDGWGLVKGSAAEHILKMSVKELSKYVDCLGLLNLPDHYCSAISDLGFKFGKSISSLLGVSGSPSNILKKIDDLLKCINMRFVIILEDIDRNKDQSIYTDEIFSLFDRLKDLENLSFVISVSNENRMTEIIPRICEHIDVIPDLPKDTVKKVIEKFRNLCKQRFPDDISLLKDDLDERIGIKKRANLVRFMNFYLLILIIL